MYYTVYYDSVSKLQVRSDIKIHVWNYMYSLCVTVVLLGICTIDTKLL